MITTGPLENEIVRLEPLRADHVGPLLEAASEGRETYALAPVPWDRPTMEGYVKAALADAAANRAVPYAIARRRDQRIVGSTRFMSLEWWSWPPGPIEVEGEPRSAEAGDPPDVVEIGHVWLAASAQRTAINTAAAALLMTHAFEVWRVHRLTLKTDARNARSRAAIARLGGVFEGILRAHLPAADGRIRDTAMFSIVRGEWPVVRERLTRLLQEEAA